MISGGSNFNFFSENKLTKLANLVEFKRMICFVWGLGLLGPPLLGYATAFCPVYFTHQFNTFPLLVHGLGSSEHSWTKNRGLCNGLDNSSSSYL